MGHLTTKSGYQKFVERLNLCPQGAPPSETLYKILKVILTEQDAGLLALAPIKPFSASKISGLWKMPKNQAQDILNNFADRGLILDLENKGKQIFALPPPMAGFIEFMLMRIRKDFDQKILAELYYQYLNVEEDFMRQLFAQGETQLGRVYVNESTLSPENALHILDYERTTEIIKTAKYIGVGLCYCRHKMQHVGKACSAEQDICMTFNKAAYSLTKHGHARLIEAAECLDLLEKAYAQNLVQMGENVREGVTFICNCCGCCCEAMQAAKHLGILNPVMTTNFLPQINDQTCTGCGKCLKVCPIEAISLISKDSSPRKIAQVNTDICLGCGVCIRNCHVKSIGLVSRPQRVITPVNSAHRIVLMAIERGKLHNLIFDNQAHWNHRAMAAILGVILKLPPLKQALASKQVKSRYLDFLLKHIKY